MTAEAIAAFGAYADRLTAWAVADPRVRGVLLLGSGADPDRVDVWSDHDIAVIAEPEAVAELRRDHGWLPDAEAIVAVGQEWHDGFKALYADGRVIEFAVTDPDGFAGFPVLAARVLAGDVEDLLRRAVVETRPRRLSDPEAGAVVLLVELVVGVGRVRRGERLSGADVIRSEAVRTFVDLLVARRGGAHPDPFDGLRRIETIDPEVAARLADALQRDPESAARGILDLAEEVLAPGWAAWPDAGVRAIRRRLDWPAGR